MRLLLWNILLVTSTLVSACNEKVIWLSDDRREPGDVITSLTCSDRHRLAEGEGSGSQPPQPQPPPGPAPPGAHSMVCQSELTGRRRPRTIRHAEVSIDVHRASTSVSTPRGGSINFEPFWDQQSLPGRYSLWVNNTSHCDVDINLGAYYFADPPRRGAPPVQPPEMRLGPGQDCTIYYLEDPGPSLLRVLIRLLAYGC